MHEKRLCRGLRGHVTSFRSALGLSARTYTGRVAASPFLKALFITQESTHA